jgi:hypothetical protein
MEVFCDWKGLNFFFTLGSKSSVSSVRNCAKVCPAVGIGSLACSRTSTKKTRHRVRLPHVTTHVNQARSLQKP